MSPTRFESRHALYRKLLEANPIGDRLFEALRACRTELAKEAGVPPYVVFHDSTLLEIVALRPSSLEGMREVTGMGEKKLERYGPAMLAVIAAATGDG